MVPHPVPTCPRDLTAPGAIDALLAFHRHQFGDARMETPAVPGTPANTPPPANPPAPAPTPTPADLDGPGQRALERERERRREAEAELQRLRDAEAARQREAETGEVTRVRTELEQQNAALQAQLSTALAGRTLDQARISATAAGVDPAHVDTFLRLVDLTGVQVRQDGSLDTDAIGAAVNAGLEAAPMFKPPLPGGQFGARRVPAGSGAGATPAPAGDLNAKVAAQVAAMQAHLGRTAVIDGAPAS